MATAVFFGALVFYVVAGAFVARRVKDSDDFLIMGGRGSSLLIVGTLAATYLSAVTMLGIAGQSYAMGPLVLVATGSFGAWIGTLLAVVYVGRRMKALGCRTMPDFFKARFDNTAVTVVATVIMIVGLLGYGVIQLIGAGLVLSEITGIGFPLMIVIFTLALLVFAALGGMYGVVVTDTLMFFTMLAVAVIIAPLIIAQAGFAEMRGLSESLPGYWTLAGTEDMTLGFTFSQFLVWIIFFTCMPALVSRVFPARNDFVILKAAIIGVFFAPLMQILVFLAAGAMQVLSPGIEDVDRVMIVGFLEYVPPILSGVGLAALMAAIMSTASTLFVLTGFGLSRDLYENLRRGGQMTEQRRLLVSRFAQVIVAVVVCAIAVARPSAIYWISIYAGAIFGVGWLPTVVAGLEWRRMNARAALASMIVGVASFVTITELESRGMISLPLFFDPLMVSFVLSITALVIAALLTRPNRHEAEYFEDMKNTSASAETIKGFLSRPDGLARLKREYRQIHFIAGCFIVLSIVIWGFFFVNLGL
jgi:sodium/pantothenate symporter